MFRFLAIAALALPLGACTGYPKFIDDFSRIPGLPNADTMRAYEERDRAFAKKYQEEALRLIEQGAMDPLDRLETEAYRDYIDAKVEASIIRDYGY